MSTIVEATPPLLSRLKFLASNLAKTHPRLFLTIARHRENHVRKLVDENTDVVIEGYMRCGNYFAVYAFEHAQPGRVRIAHHFHAPAQLMVAARLGVPSILLLRHPRDAVLSALVYYSRWLTPPLALRTYTLFHQGLLRYREAFVPSTFDETTRTFHAVIERVNRKFGSSFAPFRHTAPEEAAVFAKIDAINKVGLGLPERLSMPTDHKERLKRSLSRRLDEPRYQKLMSQAIQVYNRLAHLSPEAPQATPECSSGPRPWEDDRWRPHGGSATRR